MDKGGEEAEVRSIIMPRKDRRTMYSFSDRASSASFSTRVGQDSYSNLIAYFRFNPETYGKV